MTEARGSARGLPMTTLRSIALRIAWIGLTTVTGILAARALHPEGRGELAAMILWPMLIGGLTTFGLPSALVYHVRREREHAAALAGTAALLCLGITLIGAAVAWFVIPHWMRHQPPHIVFAAQLCLLTAPVTSLSTLGRAAWEADSSFGRSSTSQLVPPLLTIAGLGVLTWLGALTPVRAAAVYMLAGVPTVTWILVSVARAYRPTLGGASGVWRQLLHYGSRSYGVDLAGILSIYLDQALAVALLTSTSMGIYAVALNLARVVAAANSSVAMIVFPRVVGLEIDELTRRVARAARMSGMVGAAIGVAVLAAGPALLHWLYGPAFSPAAEILPILVCQVLVASFVYMLLQGFLASDRPGVATGIQLTGVAVSVPMFLFFVPRFGLTGAALALLLSACVRLILTLIGYRAILRARPRLWIEAADIADLAQYRSAFVSSVMRPRGAGVSR
jgi:O-antigen/teichoic acid export membrane protein